MQLQINEIFASIQGEGRWTGLPCVFLRLQGCNLDPPCAWCDTPDAQLTYTHNKYMTIEEVLDRINLHQPRTVVVTGGEPMIQSLALAELIRLDDDTHKWHLETNGTLPIPAIFDWVTISPKPRSAHPIETLGMAHEIKIIVSDLMDVHYAEAHYLNRSGLYRLKHIWLQPVSNDPEMIEHCIAYLLGKHDPSQIMGLSVQTHKLLGVR